MGLEHWAGGRGQLQPFVQTLVLGAAEATEKTHQGLLSGLQVSRGGAWESGGLGKWGPHRWSRGAGALSAGETGQPPAAYVLGGGHRGDSAWLVPATSHLSWVAFPTAAESMKGPRTGS